MANRKFTHDSRWYPRQALRQAILKLDPEANTTHLWDSRYVFPKESSLRRALRLDDVDQRKYIPERYDCDNFARDLPGKIQQATGCNCVGMILDPDAGHAYSVAGVIGKGDLPKLIVIEPQNDNTKIRLRSKYYRLSGAWFLWG